MTNRTEYNREYAKRTERSLKRKEYMRLWNLNNKDKVHANGKRWRDNNPEGVNKIYELYKKYYLTSTLKHIYKITKERYNELISYYNNSCYICKTPQDKLKRRLSIDHNHKTGKVRGVLCSRCNPALGSFRDDPNILQEAINYLKQHEVQFSSYISKLVPL